MNIKFYPVKYTSNCVLKEICVKDRLKFLISKPEQGERLTIDIPSSFTRVKSILKISLTNHLIAYLFGCHLYYKGIVTFK